MAGAFVRPKGAQAVNEMPSFLYLIHPVVFDDNQTVNLKK